MFIIQKSGIDISCHTQRVDAERQVHLFIINGASAEDLQIVEKDDFIPEAEYGV